MPVKSMTFYYYQRKEQYAQNKKFIFLKLFPIKFRKQSSILFFSFVFSKQKDRINPWLIINLNVIIRNITKRSQKSRQDQGQGSHQGETPPRKGTRQRLQNLHQNPVPPRHPHWKLIPRPHRQKRTQVIQIRPRIPLVVTPRRRLHALHQRAGPQLFLGLQCCGAGLRTDRKYCVLNSGGKTYTMGTAVSTLSDDNRLGIIPRVITDIFDQIDERSANTIITVTASYI